jgi:cellulose synthase/poly-beta-1,6-N-acetylglucosamine synthase-like glycosyltransferase
VPRVLASGLGPEDMASYVGRQRRWARGCLTSLATVVRPRLPLRHRAHYFLSAMFFLTGWTYLVYLSLPVVRIFTGAQPLASATANQFVIHFAPYFCASLLAVAVAGNGSFSFAAFALMEASFWIHVQSAIVTILRGRGDFTVTPKRGKSGHQLATVFPALLAISVLAAAAIYGLAESRSPGTLNNVAFAGLHLFVLVTGIWPAVIGARRASDPLTGTSASRAAEAA